MKTKLTLSALAAGAVALALVPMLLLVGCSTSPNAFERFAYTATTNTVPVATNYVRSTTVTNDNGTVETRNVVTWSTNLETHVNYTVSTNAAAIVSTGAAIGNIFSPGWGEVAGMGALGLLSLLAKLKANKANATSVVMAQGTETLLAILEAEKGKPFVDAIKLRLVRDQNAAGVLREIGKLVETTVDNEAARDLAKKLLETLPAAQPSAS